MGNRRKVALGIAGAVTVAIVAAAFALHALADPERLNKRAREAARAAWSRELRIGAVDFRLFPRPMLVATDVALANPAWAKERDLVHADRIVAHVALWPLLAGRPRFEDIALEGARANLEVGPHGEKSWETERPAGGPRSKASVASEWTRIHEVTIANADVHYRDGTGPADAWHVATAHAEMDDALHDVRIEARLVRNGHPLDARARLADLSHFGAPGATSQGRVDLDWGRTQLSAQGRIPLDHGMDQGSFDASLRSDSLEDMLAFLGQRPRHTAPLRAHARVTRSGDEWGFRDLGVVLGKQQLTGTFEMRLAGSARRFSARLESDDLDWTQALLDAGDERPAPPPAGELFPVRPLPWPMLAGLRGTRGVVDVKLGRLRLPDGIELRNATGHAAIDGDRLELKPFAAELLGGSATGAIRLEGRAKAVHVDMTAKDVLLERWFHERHRPVRFTGGPMKVRAQFSATGSSIKELAGSMTGPVSILMGPGVYASKGAGDWEARMVEFTDDDSDGEIDFECAGAALPFVSGRAKGAKIVGARSRKSGLLVSGYVDLREEAAELKGPVRPKPREGIGLAAIADDILISGKIRRLKVKLDPASTPKVIAKAGAALATAGLSVLATGASNASRADPDPCRAVFAGTHPPPP